MASATPALFADSVVSSSSAFPIDGDNDGIAGGDLVVSLVHRCPADLNGDGLVNGADLGLLLGGWGPCP